ncbi:MAG TPA: DEAD/DEAH box helicase [Acidimicrobiia bacterium]|nr:DEAD/DEAH box helicase [Acidimicrobiia bacterium]
MCPLDSFSKPTRTWFEASFTAPTKAQSEGWPAIAAGDHTLIHAPTGSGKTLAAFLWTLDRLLTEPAPPRAERCRVLYISPLKALAHDVDRNLRAPLAGIRHAAERLGEGPLPEISTFLRTGDTPAEDRRRMERNPPDILITTPESLFLMLTSAVRSTLSSVRWVIVDEVHAVAGSKRGAHLALSLERLAEITENQPQRIGLSATQRPLETIAEFLGGGTVEDEVWSPRPVTIVDIEQDRDLDVEIVVPVADMTEPADPDPLDPDEQRTRSIWPAVYPELLAQIRAHNSTIVFANSRRLAERICSEINNLAGEEIARAHHGSVAREQRLEIEEALKRGRLAAVVATSSLELGIDMGAVDLVLQIESPTSVASGLQRVGRSGHQVGGVSRAKIFPKYRGDLLVATVVSSQMSKRNVETTRIPANPIDVLSQQLVAQAVSGDTTADALYDLIRRAAPYAALSRAVFDETLDMLSGRYPSYLFAELRPRINWDRATGEVTARPGARQLAVTNPGTIPDRGLFRVTLPDGSRVGELDEEMVYESREGDTFLLGSSAWRITQITHDRVEVVPAPGEATARMPFWRGDMMGRPIETGLEVGRFIREIASLETGVARETLATDFGLDTYAASNLVAYIEEEREVTGVLPTDKTVVVERFQDEIGDWRVVLLSPLGARVHAPWAMALRHRFRNRFGTDVDAIWSDDGIAFRFPDSDDPPEADDMILDPEDVESLLIEHLFDTALFAARFREAAGRALLLPRRRPGERTPLWLQRRRSADLLGVARQFGSFPMILEVYREILQDDFDLPALQQVLGDIRSRKIRVAAVETRSPSPFASSLLFSFVAAYLYEADAPLAERRATALTLDRELLRELLGEGELRELIDPEVVAAVELELQRLTDGRRVRNTDGVHDLLRDLGPLTETDIDVRSEGVDVASALDRLAESRRVVELVVSGEERWAAIEDVARLRDGLGVQPPPGVPHVFLEPVDDPLGDVVGRYARTHGPFGAAEAATSLGLPVGVVETALTRLEQSGRVVQGAFRPGGSSREWVDDGVLKRLKRRSLAILRSEIEPVDATALARFELAWQGISPDPPRGVGALHDAIRQLTGIAVPASTLERDVLAARVADPGTGIDQLMLTGDLVWIGAGGLGTRDGRVALYPRDALSTLWAGPDPDIELDENASAIVTALGQGGASFFRDLYDSVGGGDPEHILDGLWDLVWAGLVTNDTFGPVRAYTHRRKGGGSGKRPLSGRFPAHSQGRWSLTSSLLRGADTSPTERHAAWANLLLERHGVVTRNTVLAENLPGGFSGIYPVYRHLEETGRIRRGYFVEGLGGSQFALPGAVDRLRSETRSGLVVLAATDPANAYGGVLPWPEIPDVRLARDAGAYVLLADGSLVGYLDKGRRGLTLLDPSADDYGEVSRAMAEVAARHRRLTLLTINNEPAAVSPLAAPLAEWGFATAPRGLTYRG